MAGKADWQKAKDLYPSTQMDEGDWVRVFDNNPDILWAIVGDIYDFAKAEEEREEGKVRVGRRPRRDASLTEVYATVFPEPYSMDPFPEALAKLMSGKWSQGQLSKRVPCSQSCISRWLSGEKLPDLITMERVAHACRVQPAYFVEWRALYVGGIVQRALSARPNISVRAVRELKYGKKTLEA